MKKRNIVVFSILFLLSFIFTFVVIWNVDDISYELISPDATDTKVPDEQEDLVDSSNDKDIDYTEYVINKDLSVSGTDVTASSNSDVIKENDFVVDWKFSKKINIFSNYYFDGDSKIAPGVSDCYSFKVINGRDNKIKFNINFTETNLDNINIKYRLKKEDKYIIGNDDNWVSADKLLVEGETINSTKEYVYVLEWKWFDSEHDTEIGKKLDAVYALAISIYGEDMNS